MKEVIRQGAKIGSIIFAATSLLACAGVQSQKVEQDQRTTQAAQQKTPQPHVTPVGVKIAYPEVVILEGTSYDIPPQWQGQRVDAPQLTRVDLTQIPTFLTHNKSKLFLLPQPNDALQQMAEAALQDGVQLIVHSSFRSEWYQRKIFSNMFEKGRTFEDVIRYVAPPGYSEHALGTVVDFYPSNWRFAATDTYKWLKQHGSNFHFYETYAENGSVPWEAWHWRWIDPQE